MSLIKDTLNFMFPRSCLICGSVSDIEINGCRICKSCLRTICPVDKVSRWNLCLSESFEGDKYPNLTLYVPFVYQGQVVHLIYGLKFGGRYQLAKLAGFLLSQCLLSDYVNADLIVPVPLSSKRLEERGYNQAFLIAKEVSKILNIPIAEDVLVRTRNTNRQAECKNPIQRFINVNGAFEINERWDVTGLKILIVDDVVTTGNTIHEAATVLMDCGALAVLCCAFASNRIFNN